MLKANKIIDTYLSKDKREKSVREIMDYFWSELEMDIWIIAAEDILDFFLTEVWNDIYNKALEDSKSVIRQSFGNLEIDIDVLSRK